LPVYIRKNIKLAEAPGYGQTIFEYAPNCHGSEDYRKVAQYIHDQSRTPEPQPCPIKIVEITGVDNSTQPATTSIDTSPSSAENTKIGA
jgi:nitrogenase subunit NifH